MKENVVEMNVGMKLGNLKAAASAAALVAALLLTGCGKESVGDRKAGRIDTQGQAIQGQLVGVWRALQSPQKQQNFVNNHYLIVGQTYTDFVSILDRFNAIPEEPFSGMDLDGWGYYQIEGGTTSATFQQRLTSANAFFNLSTLYALSGLSFQGSDQISFQLAGRNYQFQRMNSSQIGQAFGSTYQAGNIERLLDDLVDHWQLAF